MIQHVLSVHFQGTTGKFCPSGRICAVIVSFLVMEAIFWLIPNTNTEWLPSTMHVCSTYHYCSTYFSSALYKDVHNSSRLPCFLSIHTYSQNSIKRIYGCHNTSNEAAWLSLCDQNAWSRQPLGKRTIVQLQKSFLLLQLLLCMNISDGRGHDVMLFTAGDYLFYE